MSLHISPPFRPPAPSRPLMPSRGEQRSDSPSLEGLRVLVVEDDPDIRFLLGCILTDAGAQVASAESAAEGFEALRGFHPQLVVSDIGMPCEDGYSFIRRVRALGADGGGLVPSIALTAFTTDADRAKALGAGFTLHMGKPVEASDLVCAIKTLTQASAD